MTLRLKGIGRISCQFLLLLIFSLSPALGSLGQTDKPEMLDSFGKISNDDLQFHVQIFQSELSRDGSTGLAILHGPGLAPYFNQRRIMGCSLFLKWPEDRIQFSFANDQNDTRVEFWKIPKGFRSPEFTPNAPDYRLRPDKPVEMTVSMASDEFCPMYFKLDWYAKFLVANPALKGRAVIDVRTRNEFISRVIRYRKKLLRYGVASDRMQYYHRHFHGEHDEQFWLIPQKRK
jgi:hypothetical protein